MPSNSPRVEYERRARGGRDAFAARLATIMLRWRTVYLQQPQRADGKQWMSARAAKGDRSAPS